MDVHTQNWRMLRHMNGIVVHLVLSRDVLAHYGVPWETTPLSYSFKTRYYNYNMPPAQFTRTRGEIISSIKYPEFPEGSLAISGVVELEEGGDFNPYNVLVVRVYATHSGKCYFIPLLYINLFQNYPQDGRCNKPTCPDTTVSEQTPFQQLCQEVQHKESSLMGSLQNKSSLEVLASLLETRPKSQSETITRHHMALETPGDVRCGLQIKQAMSADIYKNEKPGPKIQVLLPPDMKFTVTKIKCSLTSCMLWIGWTTENDSLELPPVKSILETMSDEMLTRIEPLRVLKDEQVFLCSKQEAFLSTLERNVSANNYTIRQMIPVTIYDMEDIDYIKDFFVETCYVMAQTASPLCAWVRAAMVSQEYQMNHNCWYWTDDYPLWDTYPPVLGENLEGIELDDKMNNLWLELVKDRALKQQVTGTLSVSVIVNSRLEGWLVLPGGFVIKGKYELTSEELSYLRLQYG
ncbi:putative UL17-like protein [Marmot herpesvirus 1]|nr:putative UL17-like protein [Marmot herpesvirus 1]